MPNYCEYEMKIKGSMTAVERVVECLKADYNYGEGRPSHKHFFRVFEVVDEDEPQQNEDGTITMFVFGYCAWSVHSCMMEGPFTYYDDLKKSHPDIFMGTCLREQSEDCEIEVFSEESEGMFFTEHYLFKNGECLINEEDGITMKKDKYGDYVIKNPFRYKKTESFLWEID